MVCRLCLKDKVLISRSHIIPDFMYKGIFNEKHFLIETNLKDLNKKSKKPNGFYDKNILCKKCDNEIIGSFETYASKIILPKSTTKLPTSLSYEVIEGDDGLKSIRFSNIDYTKFKLFLLSILWRSHISKHYFFKNIDLGCHAEVIRKMIIENNAKENIDYETCLILLKSKNIPLKSIIEPVYLKSKGNSSYIYFINNFMFHFNISTHNKMSIFKTSITKNNTMDIAILEDKIANTHFDSYMGQKLRIR